MTQQQWNQQPTSNQPPQWNQQWNQQWNRPAGQPQWGQPAGGYQSATTPQWSTQTHTAAPWQQPAGGWQPTPAPKRTNPLLIVGGILVAVIIGFVIINSLGGGRSDGIAYQNEDYKIPPVASNPPEVPYPTSQSELTNFLEKNPLYQQTAPRPIRCEMTQVDLATATEQQLEEHLSTLTECLVRVWGKPLEDAGFTPVRFKSNVYQGTVDSPCGRIPAKNAVFCGANQQMYYSTELVDILPADLRDKPFLAELVWAHEFGHGVQARSGILASFAIGSQNMPKSEELELNRRIEVQADCFAGMFVGSAAQSMGVTNADIDNMKKVMMAIGDDELSGDPNVVGNHGRGASRVYWAQLGMASTSIGVCNSFIAPAEQVK